MKIESGTEVIADALVRGDGWLNEILSMGGKRDPSAYTRFGSRGKGLDDATLEAMHAEDHFAARVVGLVAKHGMRKGWDLRLPGNPQEAAAARALYQVKEEEIGLAYAVSMGAMWGRLFGGAVTWIGIDDGQGEARWATRQREPVEMASIERVMFVHSFDRREVNIVEGEGNPASPGYRKGKIYKITPTSMVGALATAVSAEQIAGGVDVHESRIIHWPGAPTTMQRQTERSGWDDSVLEAAWDALKQAGEDHGAKSQLLGRVAQFVFKIKGLGALITGDERKFNKRMSLLDAGRSRGKALVIDTEENVENIAQPVSGIDTIIDKSIERVANAGSIPPSVFVGRPTPEDLDMWDAEVEDWQAQVLKPRHEKVAGYILASKQGPTKGAEPETWAIVYRALRTPKPKERAELRKLQAETDAIEVDKGIMPPEAVALHRHTGNASGEGEVQLDPGEVAAALQRRRELAKRPPKDNAELGTVSARAGGGVLEVLAKLNRGEITRAQAKHVLVFTFTMTPEDAETQLDSDAEIAKLTPPPVAGKPGPAPAPPKAQGAGAPQGLPGFDDGGDAKTKTLPTEGAT